jgi:hypothetical protein
MAPAPIDPRRFYLDFIAELNRRQWPIYPQRKWWESLRCADIRDQFRSVARVNSVNDESYFERQRTYLLRHSISRLTAKRPSHALPRTRRHAFRTTVGGRVYKQSEHRAYD